MANKTFTLMSLSILTLLVVMSFASAATISNVPTLSITSGSHTSNITITPAAGETVSSVTIGDLTQSSKTIDLSVASTATPNVYDITYNVPSDFGFYFGKTYSVTLTANITVAGVTTPLTQTISFDINNPALDTGYSDNGHLDLTIDDITVEKGYGEDYQWYPLDSVKAKIDVDNNGPDKIKSIAVKYGLYDTKNGKWIFKNSESTFSLNDGDNKILEVNFNVDSISKFNVGNTGDYKFYAWATGADEADSGNKTSISNYEDIEMQFDNDLVTLSNIKVQDSANCGQSVEITADVTNIGSDDQNNVYVQITNTKLGINKKVDVGDLNSLDSTTLDYSFTVPENTEEGLYQIGLVVYNEDGDVYKTDLNDDEMRFTLPFEVKGGCSLIPTATVAAELTSASKAGQELDVKATIVNTGSSMKTFNVDLSDYSTWASLTSIDKTSVTLNAGQSQDVLIKLKVNDDVSGSQKFSINLKDGTKILSQPVSVSIESKSPFANITGLFSKLGGSNNWYLWGIGALNVVLILIIIVVAVRVIKKK